MWYFRIRSLENTLLASIWGGGGVGAEAGNARGLDEVHHAGGQGVVRGHEHQIHLFFLGQGQHALLVHGVYRETRRVPADAPVAGAQYSASTRGLSFSLRTMACSRPPLPTTRIFMVLFFLFLMPQSCGRSSTRAHSRESLLFYFLGPPSHQAPDFRKGLAGGVRPGAAAVDLDGPPPGGLGSGHVRPGVVPHHPDLVGEVGRELRPAEQPHIRFAEALPAGDQAFPEKTAADRAFPKAPAAPGNCRRAGSSGSPCRRTGPAWPPRPDRPGSAGGPKPSPARTGPPAPPGFGHPEALVHGGELLHPVLPPGLARHGGVPVWVPGEAPGHEGAQLLEGEAVLPGKGAAASVTAWVHMG